MSEELNQAKAVREYVNSDHYKSVEAQLNTEVDEETMFNKILADGRDLTDRHSELQKARHWHDCQVFYVSLIDDSCEGGKLLKEFAKKQIERTRESIIKGADLRDYKVYTDLDMERLKLAMRRECLKYAEAFLKSIEKTEAPVQASNPYEKSE